MGHSELLLDSIERYRTRCFEIATQFLAIFRTNTTINTSTKYNNSLSLLSLWTTRRIQLFLTSLSKQLVQVENSAALRDALDATVFFATSMGRIGADFSSLLPPILEPQLVRIVTQHWRTGTDTLSKTLRVCRDAGVAGPLFHDDEDNDHYDDDNNNNNSNTTSTPSPPRSLLALPPLARLLNAILTGLNELRRCLLPDTLPTLRQALAETLREAQSLLETNDKLVNVPGLKGEATKLRDVAKDLRARFESVLEPYCRTSLEVAFGAQQHVVVAAATTTTEDDKDGDGGDDVDKEEEKEAKKEVQEEKEEAHDEESITKTDETPEEGESPELEAEEENWDFEDDESALSENEKND